MAKTYLIDSENVGDSWIEILNSEENESAAFLVFYTSKSPRIDYDHVIMLLGRENPPTFISCFKGNNGLDFQLVSYLGYLLHVEAPDEMIIVSNDTGFDAVVQFWTERGQKVSRMRPDALLKNAKKGKSPAKGKVSSAKEEKSSAEEEVPSAKEEVPSAKEEKSSAKEEKSSAEEEVSSAKEEVPSAKEEVPSAKEKVPVPPDGSAAHQAEKANCIDDNQSELYTIINCLGKTNTADIHNACVNFYGTQKGEEIYKKLKKEKFAAPSVSWKLSTKIKRFSALILQYCNPSDVPVPKDLQAFLNNQVLASDTQKSAKAKFLKKYPNAQALNKILTPFYSSIVKMKK